MQNAEAALKVAKSSGERYQHHRVDMNSALARRVRMEQRLRAAVDHGDFMLYYQPKISLRTGKVTGVEALLRWLDPDEGALVPPATFLPVLESAGLMAATDSWVLRRACLDCRDWRRHGLQPLRVAVNVSPSELRRRSFARESLDAIGNLAGDQAWGIDIEITEGALADDSSSVVHALRLLRAAGIKISIDDFGTGFSSLGRLSELPVDTLKIDRTFTNRVPVDRKICKLVSTIIDLAHAFNMSTVAEGVETQAQLEYLSSESCDESQGYLHSRPIPGSDLERWLAAPESWGTDTLRRVVVS